MMRTQSSNRSKESENLNGQLILQNGELYGWWSVQQKAETPMEGRTPNRRRIAQQRTEILTEGGTPDGRRRA